MNKDGNLEQMTCAYMGCTAEAISIICANKAGEESIYNPACACHEPVIRQDMKDLHEHSGYTITIVDVANENK